MSEPRADQQAAEITEEERLRQAIRIRNSGRALLPDIDDVLADAVTDQQFTEEDVQRYARAFHEAYERLAPEFSYQTREASAVPWDEVPANNRALMTATARAVLAALVEDGWRKDVELLCQYRHRMVHPAGGEGMWYEGLLDELDLAWARAYAKERGWRLEVQRRRVSLWEPVVTRPEGADQHVGD